MTKKGDPLTTEGLFTVTRKRRPLLGNNEHGVRVNVTRNKHGVRVNVTRNKHGGRVDVTRNKDGHDQKQGLRASPGMSLNRGLSGGSGREG